MWWKWSHVVESWAQHANIVAYNGSVDMLHFIKIAIYHRGTVTEDILLRDNCIVFFSHFWVALPSASKPCSLSAGRPKLLENFKVETVCVLWWNMTACWCRFCQWWCSSVQWCPFCSTGELCSASSENCRGCFKWPWELRRLNLSRLPPISF